ncbi:MAG: right-handed parallel beta-helix repeat-containing protein, partial [Pseudomonadales bacterium]|nr:right-handed parallel beta-helix repeat-containing protein [Pseudomonadales bacterium]
RGIYVFIEQLGESTLRSAGVMPGDLYRGEMVGKDAFYSIGERIWLFDSSSLWDKMSANNHYVLSSMAPLEQLLDLLDRRESEEAQIKLSQLLDMKKWGRFSAFETLAHTKHFSKSHNWRLYYDPWRQKFLPVVWDPAGWRWQPPIGKRTVDAVINSKLHQALFMNGDFLRARNSALENYFRSGADEKFLHFVADTIDRMSQEVKQDPFLRPSEPEHVVRAMRKLEFRINQVFADIQEEWASDANTGARYRYHDSLLQLGTGSRQTIQRLRIHLLRPPDTQLRASVEYLANGEMKQIDLSGAVQVENSTVLLNTEFLSRQSVYEDVLLNPVTRLHTSPGFYRIRFEGLDPELEIVSVEVDRGDGWLPVEKWISDPLRRKEKWGRSHWETFGKAEGRTLSGDFVAYVNNYSDLLAAYQESYTSALDFDEGKELEPTDFGQLYAPVAAYPLPDPVIWSGTVTFAGHQILKDDLIIQPGTTVRFAPDATLVLKGRLLAEGTPERPIRFLSQQADQAPWGAIVLMGQGANGSRLTHCEMAGGSGRKGDLFEYSAMFSVHDVKDVSVQDCLFRDNRVVDDMVHTVYADIRFERTRFENAFADALDLDISEVVIIDSRFDNSGNDAVDLMTTRAHVVGSIFVGNGDKGISVGENSQLCAVNNRLIGNAIGVESKDRSTAVLFNHTFVNNKTALHAYKKNWRYGTGGRIFIAKSAIFGSEKVAAAKKESAIHLFDSYVDRPLSGKRVSTVSVDGLSRKFASRTKLFPRADEYGTGCDIELIEVPEPLRQHIQAGRCGDYIDG